MHSRCTVAVVAHAGTRSGQLHGHIQDKGVQLDACTNAHLRRCRGAQTLVCCCHAAVLLLCCPAAVSLVLLCRGVDVLMHGSAAGRLFGSAAGLPCCCAAVPPSWSPLCRRAASSLSCGTVEMPGGQAAARLCCGAVVLRCRRASVPPRYCTAADGMPCLCATALLRCCAVELPIGPAAVWRRCCAAELPCC
jgi:hypothetical protein